MLRIMRTAAKTFIAKLLLLLLVASFAVWGIADFVRESPSDTVASVGNQTVSVAEFQQTLTTDLQRLSRSTGQNFTIEQAQAFGLPSRILSRILAEKTLDQDTKRFNIVISEPLMAQSIMEDPQFFGEDGKFSRVQYDNILRTIDMSEPQFLRQRTGQMQRQMLASSMLSGVALPKALNHALSAAFLEERKIKSFPILMSSIPMPAMPDDATLMAYYESTKSQYFSDEYRKVEIIHLKQSEIIAQTSVTDAEIKAYYEAQKSQINTPEKRRVLQLIFQDIKSAEEFHLNLKSKTFDKLAEARGEDADSFDLGYVTREDLVDNNVMEKAFSIKKGDSAVIPNGQFGPVVIQITDIEDAKSPNFDSVKGKLSEELKTIKAREQSDIKEKNVDEALANGTLLSDIANEYRLGFQQIAAINRYGKSPDGKDEIAFDAQEQVLKSIFETAEGFEIQPIKMPNGDMVWISVVKITPSTQKPFETVKSQLFQSWAKQKQFETLQSNANSALLEIKSNKNLPAYAQSIKVKTSDKGYFSRGDAPSDMTSVALDAVFQTKPNDYGLYFDDKLQNMVVFQVVDTRIPDRVKDGLPKEQETTLTSQYQDDLYGLYVHARQNAMGIKVDQAAVNKIVNAPSVAQ